MDNLSDKFYEFITESKLPDIMKDIKDGLIDGLSVLEIDGNSIITDGTAKISITDNSFNRSDPQTMISDNPTAIHEILYIIKSEDTADPQIIISKLENFYTSFIAYLGG